MSNNKKRNVVSVNMTDDMLLRLNRRIPENGLRCKVIRHLIEMFLNNEVKVILPGVEAKEI